MTAYTDWVTALSTNHTDLETLRFYHDCGIGGVELSVRWPFQQEIDWQAFRKNADAAGIQILSFHLPFSYVMNIACLKEEDRQNVVATHKRLMKEAASVGISRFVIHPSAEPIPEEERPLWLQSAKKSLKELAEFAASLDAVLCVEDLPRSCLGNTADEMLELIGVDDRLRVCFDVNHLCLNNGGTHQEFIDKLGDKIVTTHMSDYDFVDEKHFFPGVGMINWKALVEGLETIDYCGPFLYEGGFTPSAKVPDAPYGKIEDARQRHLTIKELEGNAL